MKCRNVCVCAYGGVFSFPSRYASLISKRDLHGFHGGLDSKESACNAGDLGSIPGLGRSPGEGKGYPLQYSSLENSTDCIVHGVTKSRTRLSNFLFQSSTVQHRKLHSIFCNNLDGKRTQKRAGVSTCRTESLCYTPEENTRL